MKKSLNALFNPAGVAIIGASREEESIGSGILRNLMNGGYKGQIFPVNPKADKIMGLKCYSSVKDIEEEVDLAFIAIPRKGVVPVLQECVGKGIKAVVVLSAGFKEADEEGAEMEEKLAEIASENDMALLGPNCLGVINTEEKISFNGTFADKAPGRGNISFISQSGAVGVYALEYAKNHQIDFSKFASLGNKAVTTENDILEAYIEDDQTRVILAYLEDLENPQRFLELGTTLKNRKSDKPLVVLKAGGSKSGRRAAESHTGALTESDEVLDHLFEQHGIIRVQNLESMFYAARVLSAIFLPHDNRLAIITNAGGPGIITADAAEKVGLQVPALSENLQKELLEGLPQTVSVENPVDLVGDANAERYEQALKVLLKSDETDILLFLCTPQMMTDMDEIARTISRYSDEAIKTKKLIVAVFADFNEKSKVKEIFAKNNVPYFRFGNNAVKACAAAVRYKKYKEKPDEKPENFQVKKENAEKLLEEAKTRDKKYLAEPEVYRIFEDYGFTVSPYKVVQDKEELIDAAHQLDYPLVAKIFSKQVIHKSDAGGVVTGIKNDEDVKAAFENINQNIDKNDPEAQREGVVLQKMVEEGMEFIAGARYSEKYGHLIMFGLGGIFVELIGDVTFRRAPLTPSDAMAMVEGINSKKVFDGVRGKPVTDKNKLADCLMRLSQLVTDFPQIKEVDINPVFGMEDTAIVADARLFIRE